MVARKRLIIIITLYVHCVSYLDIPKPLELSHVLQRFEWENVKQRRNAWSFDIKSHLNLYSIF